MARIFVTDESGRLKVEVEQGQLDGEFSAYCSACGSTSNLFDDERQPASMADAIDRAGAHADSCG